MALENITWHSGAPLTWNTDDPRASEQQKLPNARSSHDEPPCRAQQQQPAHTCLCRSRTRPAKPSHLISARPPFWGVRSHPRELSSRRRINARGESALCRRIVLRFPRRPPGGPRREQHIPSSTENLRRGGAGRAAAHFSARVRKILGHAFAVTHREGQGASEGFLARSFHIYEGTADKLPDQGPGGGESQLNGR